MSVSTWDLLKSIGFIEDDSLISDSPGGLSFDFGNFKLSVTFCLNQWLRESVMLFGVMSTSRTITHVESEMPREVESSEQGVAWITWCLDNHARDRIFEPSRHVSWLTEGRNNFYLLPWERTRVAYENRPHCHVQRDWARVALRNISEKISTLDDEYSVTFQFNGEILVIRCADAVIAMPARGKKWPFQYSLKAGVLRRTPKRLMRDTVLFSVWESKFSIDRICYKDATAVELVEDHNSSKSNRSEKQNLLKALIFDPTLMGLVFNYGANIIKNGTNNYAIWEKKMINDVGEAVRPYLPSGWVTINAWPIGMKYDDEIANVVFEYIGALYQEGITDKEEIRKSFIQFAGEEYSGLIDSAYAGIKEWPGFKKEGEKITSK